MDHHILEEERIAQFLVFAAVEIQFHALDQGGLTLRRDVGKNRKVKKKNGGGKKLRQSPKTICGSDFHLQASRIRIERFSRV